LLAAKPEKFNEFEESKASGKLKNSGELEKLNDPGKIKRS
jgi:hypothetical protein